MGKKNGNTNRPKEKKKRKSQVLRNCSCSGNSNGATAAAGAGADAYGDDDNKSNTINRKGKCLMPMRCCVFVSNDEKVCSPAAKLNNVHIRRTERNSNGKTWASRAACQMMDERSNIFIINSGYLYKHVYIVYIYYIL